MAPGEFRLRIAYAKTGRLRYLSHLEVVHALERGARRADLPYAVTRGFNPHMKMAFGPALPVGTAGLREYFDLWLNRYLPAGDALTRLTEAMPHELSPIDATYVGGGLPSISAACTLAAYEIVVEGKGIGNEAVKQALDELVRAGELKVEHKGKTKVYDLGRSIPKEPRITSGGDGVIVEMMIRMGQEGSLRPEALLNSALSRIENHGAVMTVTRVDTLVEEGPDTARPM